MKLMRKYGTLYRVQARKENCETSYLNVCDTTREEVIECVNEIMDTLPQLATIDYRTPPRLTIYISTRDNIETSRQISKRVTATPLEFIDKLSSLIEERQFRDWCDKSNEVVQPEPQPIEPQVNKKDIIAEINELLEKL